MDAPATRASFNGMAGQEPVVISYLKLTPAEQHFFRIKQLFEEPIVQKLNYLTVVLVATREPHTSPEVQKIFSNLRQFGEKQCLKAADVFGSSSQYATNFMLKLVDHLILPWTDEGVPSIARLVAGQSGVMAERCEDTVGGLEQFCQEIHSAVRRISELITKDKGAASVVLTPENSRVVEELIQAVRECCTLLRQIREYYLSMETHFRDPDLLESGSPSDEEIDYMRKRWTEFAQSLNKLNHNWGMIMSHIALGPDVRTAEKLAESWKSQGARAASGPAQSDPRDSTKAIAGSLPPDTNATPSAESSWTSRIRAVLRQRDRNSNQPEPPAPTRAILTPLAPSPAPSEANATPSTQTSWTSWLRALLRRIMSCLSLKKND